MEYQPKSEFGKYILDKYNNNVITESEAYYILFVYFDAMNSEDADENNIPIDKFDEILSIGKNKYHLMVDRRLKEGLILVDLLKETDNKTRDKLVKELEELY